MARLARSQTFDPLSIQIVHVWNRCVRRAFLCGQDPVSGQDFEHRRGWARQRLEHLAAIFAIDCITFSLMSNHTHQILRSRPDIAATWSDREVARRWVSITPNRDRSGNRVNGPKQSDIDAIAADADLVGKLRVRLSDVSWWMRYFSQPIAYAANREDDATGHFWEGRFGSEVIQDEASVLGCMLYVDLNPVRAELATSPEESDYTGAKERIDDLRVYVSTQADGAEVLQLDSRQHTIHDWERLDNKCSGWLCPIEIDEANDAAGPNPQPSPPNESGARRTGRRASGKGVLAMPLTRYLELLDWVGRQMRADKRGAIPKGLQPILNRLGLNAKSLLGAMLERSSLASEAKFTPNHPSGLTMV